MSRRVLCLAFLAATPLAAQNNRVQLDRQGDTVLVVRLGPVALPANADHDRISQLALQTWRLPAGGWLRGYQVEMVDRQGRVLPSSLIHHAELVDLERRDLLRPAYNRVASVGKETAALLLPAGMGYPVRAGQELGINAMLANTSATGYPEAYVRATFTLVPQGAAGVRDVMGFYAETSYDSTGNSAFDLPAGETTRVVHFTVPVAGQVLAMGGHIHDFGTRFIVVRAGGDTLYNVTPRLDASGTVRGMPTVPFFGRTVRVAPGDRFTMTVHYNNTSGRTMPGAGMGTLGVVFRPDDLSAWPALDRNDPAVQRDLATLRNAHGTAGHHH